MGVVEEEGFDQKLLNILFKDFDKDKERFKISIKPTDKTFNKGTIGKYIKTFPPNRVRKTSFELQRSFFENKAVPNVWRYNLNYIDKSWVLNEHETTEIPGSNYNDKLIIPNDKNILLVLESPHKDEYTSDFKPKGPAQVITGNNIKDYFTSHALPLLQSFGLSLNEGENYKFCIVNPVPYQASLVYFLNQTGLNTSIRNKVWNKLFSYLGDHLVELMKDSKAKIVINACTGGKGNNSLKSIVTKFIKEKIGGDIELYKTPHPCTWHILASFNKL